MKKVIKFTLIIGITVISIDRLLGLVLSNLYEKNYCYNAGGHLNHYLKHSPNDTIIIGSSRVSTMINPEIIGSNVLNISMPAKHLFYNVAIIDLMNQYKKMPRKMIIFNLEVEDLYQNNNKKLIEDVIYLKYYYHSNNFIKSIINQKNSFEKFKFLFSTYRFNGENFTIVTNPFQNICVPIDNGFGPLTITQNDNYRLKKGVADIKKLKMTSINPDFFVKLKHLFYLCKKNNVELIVLYGPNYYIPKKYTEASNIISKYCAKYKVEFLNFSEKYKLSFKSENLWSDEIHLNNIGAEKYSLLLKKELRNITKKTDN